MRDAKELQTHQKISKAIQEIWDYHHVRHDARECSFLQSVDGIVVFCSSDLSVADFAADTWIHAVDVQMEQVLDNLGTDGHKTQQGSSARPATSNSESTATGCTAASGHGRGGSDDDGDRRLRVPYLLFSGGMGTGPHSGANLCGWKEPEADVLAHHAKAYIASVRPDLLPHLRMLVENQAKNSGENVSLSHALLVRESLPARRLVVVQKPFMERRTYVATFHTHIPHTHTLGHLLTHSLVHHHITHQAHTVTPTHTRLHFVEHNTNTCR